MPPSAGDNRLEDALIKAFNLDSLKRMTRRQLGLVLEREVNLAQGTKYIVGDLVQLSLREGWRDDLVRSALADNPKHPLLLQAAKSLNIAPAALAPAIEQPAGATAGSLDQGALEKLVRERGVFLKWQDFTRKMGTLGHQLCRIEIPTGSACGTGWLVAPDLVLTNYHVIEDVQKDKIAAADVTCRFDYFVDDTGGVACGLAVKWLEDWSPYADSDKRADAPEPTSEQVDYAIVRLARAIGNETVDRLGVKRGWLQVSATPPVVLADDILMVPQFPDGRSLELAFGKALEYNNSATRLRYDVNTDEGSSGSPCVTVALEPFGLHHASGPARALRYNQCVPLRLVVQRLTRQKVAPFWQV